MDCEKCRWKWPERAGNWCRYFNAVPIVCHYEFPEKGNNQEILNLLKEIADNKEVCMTGGSEEQYDADEPRYSLKISGPKRLIKKLADILWEIG